MTVPTSEARIAATTVFVRGLTLDAEIGLYAHEKGRKQPLIVDVELAVEVGEWPEITHTVNYERIVKHAQAIIAVGHIGLVETFAMRLAQACIAEPRVTRARVRVEKPLALAPHAAAAGVEIVAVKG